jgi:cell division control protein 7
MILTITGTFSTVYKAVQLPQDDEEDIENDVEDQDQLEDAPAAKRRKTTSRPQAGKRRRRPEVVALKKIYVTSSPHRILNELELLHELRDSPYICPLLMAMRHLDQVVAVLPYFRHLDFRYYYRDFLVNDMRHYFRSLFSALHHVHKAGILHRDINLPISYMIMPVGMVCWLISGLPKGKVQTGNHVIARSTVINEDRGL